MRPIEVVLFDLDDTLLGNDMNRFLKSYFPLLAQYVQPFMDGQSFLSELLLATQAMINNIDPNKTNREIFWSVFSERTGLNQAEFEPFVDTFYRERFGELKEITQRKEVARSLVEYCFKQHIDVVIATNPLFPLDAIQQRLSWAGVPIEEFPYALVTGYENMHFAKPHQAYFEEIFSYVGEVPEKALMVGDDWENDIVPAKQLGCYAYWITNCDSSEPDDQVTIDGKGTLEQLYQKLRSGWLMT